MSLFASTAIMAIFDVYSLIKAIFPDTAVDSSNLSRACELGHVFYIPGVIIALFHFATELLKGRVRGPLSDTKFVWLCLLISLPLFWFLYSVPGYREFLIDLFHQLAE